MTKAEKREDFLSPVCDPPSVTILRIQFVVSPFLGWTERLPDSEVEARLAQLQRMYKASWYTVIRERVDR